MSRSPNYDNRSEGSVIDMLVMHYTGMQSGQEAIDRLCDEAYQVSAHYVVEEDGAVIQLVDEDKRAWHAGHSHWRGHDHINHCSIGIEIVNPGHEFGYCRFPVVQMEAVRDVSVDIISRHLIEARNVIGHSDIAPDRKQDPGELFDWCYLAENGVGVWSAIDIVEPQLLYQVGEYGDAITRLQQKLMLYGYFLQCNGEYDEVTAYVVTAFKRHFSPETLLLDGWDELADARLQDLLARVT